MDSIDSSIKDKLEEIVKKLNVKKAKSKNKIDQNIGRINHKEIIEFFDKEYNEDFNSNNETFKHHLIPLIEDYHQFLFTSTNVFQDKCLNKLNIISNSIKEETKKSNNNRTNYRKYNLFNKKYYYN